MSDSAKELTLKSVPEDDPQTEEGDLIKEAERVARVMRENAKDLDPDVKAILYKNLSEFYL